MTRPLSNAETTFMPELYPETEPMRVADLKRKCAWCGINLAAISDAPRPVFAPNGEIVYTHAGGCTSAFREVVGWSGQRTEPSAIMEEAGGLQ